MYDINKVAELTGVSKVTIYKKIKNIKELEPFIVNKDDKTYILDEGLELIKVSLQVNKSVNYDKKSEVAITDVSTDLTVNKGLINLLTEQLTEKDKQLAEKDRQIAELHKLIENSQILLKEEQKKKETQLYLQEHFEEVDQKLQDIREKMNNKKEENKSFFKKIFK